VHKESSPLPSDLRLEGRYYGWQEERQASPLEQRGELALIGVGLAAEIPRSDDHVSVSGPVSYLVERYALLVKSGRDRSPEAVRRAHGYPAALSTSASASEEFD
jgi:hypothetical protein